jgi:hypothetical protein
VRVIRRNIAHLALAGGLLSSSEVTCDHFYYARHAGFPASPVSFPVKQVSMTLTTDYSNPPFHNLFLGKDVNRHREKIRPVRSKRMCTTGNRVDRLRQPRLRSSA